MRIKIINPNTTLSMTAKIESAAKAVAAAGTHILAVSPQMGPASIESHYDEAMSMVGMLDEVRKGETEGYDGYVIACFGDPGLYAAREVASGPVIGIAEASMYLASMVATGFSIVTTLQRTCIIAEHLLDLYGMRRFCRRVRGTELAVLELEREGSDAYRIIVEECRRAIKEDGAGVIVLGCAGMADLCQRITLDIGVPVIEGVGAAVKLVEALVGLGIKTSKLGDFAPPLPKPYSGMLFGFAYR